MTRDVLIGIDAGTSVIKAVAFDLEGNELAVAARPNSYDTLPGGAVEQDMARTWADTAAVLKELTDGVPGLSRRVAALAVTGQGDGTWLIDRDGDPVAPGWLWLDSRAAGIVREFDADGVRRAVYGVTGCGMNACNQSAQLVWLKRNAPEILDRATTAQHCKDWLYFKLTGERVTDVSEGIFTFGNFRTRTYAPDILEAIGIPELRRLLPETVDGTCTSHPLTAEAASITGLPQGLPVSLGFVDVICSALGGGLYEPGQDVGLSIVGSTGMHMRLFDGVDSIELPVEPSGYTMPFPVPGTVARMHSNMAATLNIDWIVGIVGDALRLFGQTPDRREVLTALDARVLEAKPGAALFHPYIHEAGERGPFLDANARAQLTGLAVQAGLLEVVRAVYEGLALAARDCFAAIGHRPQEVRLGGGATRSRAFRVILSSALGVPLRESRRAEAGAAGAAMMAAVAIGAVPDLATACRAWVTPCLGDSVPPDPALAALYDRLFPAYLATREAMPPVWAKLAAARARPSCGERS
jgi:erythritol kinase (D-erythritol 1-phosphate-forming)